MTIQVRAYDSACFLAVFLAAHTAGAAPMATGGNAMELPDGTDGTALRELARLPGVSVAGQPIGGVPEPDSKPAAKKSTRSSGRE